MFRAATIADIPALGTLWTDGWHEAHAAIVPAGLTALRTYDSFVDRLTRDLAACRIGQIDGTIVGFHIVKDAEIYQFYVGSAMRGTGFATSLMDDAEGVLRGAGVYGAWLTCTIGNDRAAAFYTKAGWDNVGTEQLDLDTSAGAFPLTVWRFEKLL